MRLYLLLSLTVLLSAGCQDVNWDSGSDRGDNSASNLPTFPDEIEMSFYSFDHLDIVPNEAKVGDIIDIDVSELNYDRSEAHHWSVWTGDSGVWNSLVLGPNPIATEVHRFQTTFPGSYIISWCPVNAALSCVLYGKLMVTGEVTENQKPDVELFYEDGTVVKTLCSIGCRHLIDTNQNVRLEAQITDIDDDDHSIDWWGRLAFTDGYVKNEVNVTQAELSFTPTEQGSYTFSIKTFDGHLTVDGRQFTQSYWYFVARDADNELPHTSFSMVGHDGVTASMQFEYDSIKKQYYPVIDYYFEHTFTIADCAGLTGCDNDELHFDLYQNNHVEGETIPVFTVGDTVSFNASASSDPEGEALYYLWSGFNDDADGNLIGSLPHGENDVTYDLELTVAGDYYVTLCVQEDEHLSIYTGYADEWLSLQFLPLQKCPQIQFRVTD